MTMDEFYKSLEKAIEEEHDAGSLYISLAANAPDEEDRKCLMKMARQEVMHKANLEWMHLKRNM